MKLISNIVGALLGLLFIAFGLMVLLKIGPTPTPPPEGTPIAHFMAAFAPTGYLTFVKVLEVLGGLLVALPRTRNFGLLVLGPIIINILAFHIFVTQGEGLFNPVIVLIVLLTLWLLWCGRRDFADLLHKPTPAAPPGKPL